jgi:hypothetical protein
MFCNNFLDKIFLIVWEEISETQKAEKRCYSCREKML